MMKHVKSGKGGLVELSYAPMLRMSLSDTAGGLLRKINEQKGWEPEVA